jgi:hypothetical protein
VLGYHIVGFKKFYRKEASNNPNNFNPENTKTATAIDRSTSSSRAALSNLVQGTRAASR